MNELQFKREIKKAEQLKQAGDADYWSAYQLGLRQGFEKSVSKKEHNLYVSYLKDPDLVKQQKGKGYRDGLMIAEFKPKVGRPSSAVQAVKYTIRLTQTTIDNIPAPAPEKRKWVQKLVESHVTKPTVCEQCKRNRKDQQNGV
jgi:hypothetical protein